jgi:predicted Zn-dependent protease
MTYCPNSFTRYFLFAVCLVVSVPDASALSIEGARVPDRLASNASAAEDASRQDQSVEDLEKLGIDAFEQRKFKDAVRYLSAAKSADPKNPILAAALGQALISAGSPSEAVAPLNEALAADSGNVPVRLALAQTYQRLDQDGKVLNLLKADATASASPVWLFTLAFSEFRLGQLDDAEAIFRKLSKNEQMAAASSFFVGNCRFGQNDLNGALAWYDVAIQRGTNPQNPALNAYYYNQGLALFRLERYSEASTAFTASLRFDPRDPLPLYFLGRSLAETGQTQDSLSSFEQLVKDHPDFSPAYYQLGRLYSHDGRQEKAKEMFAKVKEMKNAEVREQQLLKGMKLGDH